MDLKVNKFLGTAAAAACLFAAQPASAVTYSFLCISNNSGICSSVATQMSVSVVGGPTANTASFTFSNAGPILSSITDVYFESSVLTQPLVVGTGTSPGVSYGVPASPGNLPGGNVVNFQTTDSLSADSNSGPGGVSANGVNIGEQLELVATLLGSNTLNDLYNALGSGSTRLGLHIQSIGGDNGESDSMITVVPVPGALPLMASGLLAAGFLARRRKSS